jgi:uncharacterized membrane protein (UPF0127 family)
MRRLALGFAAILISAGLALAQDDSQPTGPQPTLPTEPLSITADNGTTYHFTVELPVTQQQQDTGEMFRKYIPPNAGMLFIFPTVAVQNMWMENCPVPEDMLFIGPDGTIKSIAENTVPYSQKDISSGVPVLATLELQGGITAADDINVGDKVIAKNFTGG